MVDTLLHHYQRLWKAEATQEILICCKTSVRARSAGRNYGSLGNLASSPYLPGNSSLVPKKSSKVCELDQLSNYYLVHQFTIFFIEIFIYFFFLWIEII